jgi:GntR family transcriptional regulator/MocR family aminotransferase
VLYAYEQLASEGFVASDRRGTVVAPMTPAPAAAQVEPAPQPPVLRGLSRRASKLRWENPVLPELADGAGAFVPGVPALAEFPLSTWRRMLERAWRGLDPARLNYGDPGGEPALREAVADHLRAWRGVVCDASQVLITDGTQHSLDLCLRAYSDSGDRIWLENPGYGGALAASRAAGLKVSGIGLDAQGMAPRPADWRRRPPSLIYVTPSHQYPTGCVMSLGRRLALLAGARAAGALIIEDDYDSEFRHDGAPLSALQGLAADAPVLYLGTFSKTMFPGLRIGFLVAPAALAPALLRMAGHLAPRGRSADQLALAEFLRSGQFARHVRRMRRLYRQRRDALAAALQRHLGDAATLHGASAGMHLALRLNDARLSDAALAAQASAHGLALSALSTHAVQGDPGWNGFLLGYAQVPAERMDGLARQLAALVR